MNIRKKAFTIMELMISIVVIGILATLSFKGYDTVIVNGKAKKVEKTIEGTVAAIADAQQFGGFIWGGKGDFTTTVPNPNADIGTCNFWSDLADGSAYCEDDGVIQAEITLYKKLQEIGWSVRGAVGSQEFYMNDFPSSKLAIIAGNDGWHYFMISGIPGDIGAKVYENINRRNALQADGTQDDADGSNGSRPLIILPQNATNITDAITSLEDSGESPVTLFSYTGFTNMATLDKISSYPRVDLVYVYGTTESSWQ